MPKLAVVATIEIAPGRFDDYLALLLAHRTRCLRDEPGTLQFEVLQPRDDRTKLMLYEVYSDDAAFEAHLKGASMARQREAAAGMTTKVSGTKCSLLA
jgi:quinol monooxygenase YgiN